MPWKKKNPSTHVVEQDENGNIFPVEAVYLIKQTQPEEEYYQRTIYVYTDKDEAIKVCRKLNKEYGDHDTCVFNKQGDFVKVNEDYYYDDAHYYEVEEMLLNEEYV